MPAPHLSPVSPVARPPAAAGFPARHATLSAGLLTGLAGGLAMLAVALSGAVSQGLDALHPLRVIGETLVGPGAFEDAAAQAAFGALLHLVTAAALGVILSAAIPGDYPLASALGVGVGLTLLAFMAMMPLVVAPANPGFRGAMQDMGGTWVLAHAAYGLAIGLAPALRRRLERRAGASVPGAAPVSARA